MTTPKTIGHLAVSEMIEHWNQGFEKRAPKAAVDPPKPKPAKAATKSTAKKAAPAKRTRKGKAS